MSATLAMQKTRGQRSPFPCCRDHWVVHVEDENLETCISPASAGPLFALGLMSQFEFWRCPWKITARADHVGGALLTARATGHCHLPRLKISTEALRHAAYSRSLDNGIPVSQTRSCRHVLGLHGTRSFRMLYHGRKALAEACVKRSYSGVDRARAVPH